MCVENDRLPEISILAWVNLRVTAISQLSLKVYTLSITDQYFLHIRVDYNVYERLDI